MLLNWQGLVTNLVRIDGGIYHKVVLLPCCRGSGYHPPAHCVSRPSLLRPMFHLYRLLVIVCFTTRRLILLILLLFIVVQRLQQVLITVQNGLKILIGLYLERLFVWGGEHRVVAICLYLLLFRAFKGFDGSANERFVQDHIATGPVERFVEEAEISEEMLLSIRGLKG
jgi:hypothetical protein